MSEIDDAEKTVRIRVLNDQARRALGVGCRCLLTDGVSSLSDGTQSRIREAVERFDAFTPDNDPHGEHDFGDFDLDGETIFWKIDYYDSRCERGSEDPSDPAQTTRVLTIMLASEY